MKKTMLIAGTAIMLPMLSYAQGLGDNISGLNGVLEKLFEEMLPKCSQLINVSRAIAGFGALWYIALRVWKHLAKAEAIDFYPLLRPFAIGLAILLFPQVIGLMNGVLSPTVVATAAIAKDSHKAIRWHLEQQEQNIKKTPPGVYPDGGNGMDKYEQPDGTGGDNGSMDLKSAFSFLSFGSMFKAFISWLVQVLYETAGLCINTIRTFYLVLLAILGPLVLGLSVFDGFQQSLASWFARYINVYMWLPVANIFAGITSTILENMVTLAQDFFSSTAYIIFMIISIVGYMTVPTVANYIVQVGGKDTLLHKVSNMAAQSGKAAGQAAVKALI